MSEAKQVRELIVSMRHSAGQWMVPGWDGHKVADLLERVAALLEPVGEGWVSVEEPYRVFMDGDQWCAVGPGFKNLQESPAGFGDTPHAALYALSLDTPGNRNPESRYAGYKGEPLPSNATDDQKAAWQEGKRAASPKSNGGMGS